MNLTYRCRELVSFQLMACYKDTLFLIMCPLIELLKRYVEFLSMNETEY